MDLIGSLVDTNVRIYPSQKLHDFIKTISIDRATPYNIAKLAKGEEFIPQNKTESVLKPVDYSLTKKDIKKINHIKNIVKSDEPTNGKDTKIKNDLSNKENNENAIYISDVKKDEEKADGKKACKKSNYEKESDKPDGEKSKDEKSSNQSSDEKESENNDDTDSEEKTEDYSNKQYLVTTDIDWLYKYLKEKRSKGDKNVPFLHVLLEGVDVVMPENQIIKRNPILEERCVKLRSQQEAREYRNMTKSVDNVRIRFPEDSISYQMKQLNRQLIAIGQFILSIFAGFLFGFQGLQWIIGNLEFGFRLLLGVMCAVIIALAEIYFLAKKLNEELSVPETVQLGGPAKFAEEPTCHGHKISKMEKEHKD